MVKILKYDLYAFRKYAIPLFIAMLALGGVVGGLRCVMDLMTPELAFEVDLPTTVALAALSSLTGICYAALFVSAVVLCIAVLYRFYRTMYTDEGYLTHVLPLSKGNLLFAKTLSGYIAVMATLFVTVLSMSIASLIPYFVTGDDSITYYFYGFGEENLLLEIVVLFLQLLTVLLVAVSMLLVCYLAITLGSVIFRKHKILGAFLAFSVIESIVNTVSMIFELALIPVIGGNDSLVIYNLLSAAMSILLHAGIAVGAYALTYKCLSKRLNLD